MDEFVVIVPPRDQKTAMAELRMWLDEHPEIRDRLGDADLIVDVIYSGPDSSGNSHRYRIRRTLWNPQRK